MANKNHITEIKQNGLQRRMAITFAGARGGIRLLGNQASSMFLNEEQKRATRLDALSREATIFTEKLGELKGAYVKIGQMMALYGEHVLPKEVSNALHKLEHKTKPLDWSVIEPEIKRSLGEKYNNLVVNQDSIAAASLAQVHTATLKRSNKILCIKVQYPGVANTIESDFSAVLRMLRFTRWIQSGRDMEAWMLDIKKMLLDEVDYFREATMTRKIATLLNSDARYLVPCINRRYSGKTVLIMDYLEGVEVTHPMIKAISLQRRNNIAKAMLEIFFKEVFEWGVMQTDPNFGNYRVQLRSNSKQDDKLILLDFGAVRQLETQFRFALGQTIIAAHKNDIEGVINASINLGCLRTSQTMRVKKSFAEFCILLMEPFKTDHSDTPDYALNEKNQYRWQESRLLKRAAILGAKSLEVEGFSSPPKEFALIARKLTGVFTFVSTLKAEFNASKIIDQYCQR